MPTHLPNAGLEVLVRTRDRRNDALERRGTIICVIRNVCQPWQCLWTWLRLLRRSVRTDFGFALGVFQISKLRGHSAGDRCGLAAGLETCKVGAIAPGNRSAQPLAGRESCIMHNVDQPLVIRFALFVA